MSTPFCRCERRCGALGDSSASGIGPVIAGYLTTLSSFGWPLLIGGMLKIGYDLALLGMFSGVRPPEERLPPPAGKQA